MAPAPLPQPPTAEEGPPIPPRVTLPGAPVYITGQRLGKGGFGQVFLGTRAGRPRTAAGAAAAKPAEVALKFEHASSRGCAPGGPPSEWGAYAALGGALHGVPRLYYKGAAGDWYVMAMQLLGPSLWDAWSRAGQALDARLVACVAVEALAILRLLHARGYVHGDVKPENFLLGRPGTPDANKLFLVDFGLAQCVVGHAYEQRPDDFRGTVRYASVHAHLGRTPSRRDDLESLAYTLFFLLNGRLPWQGYQGDNKGFLVARRKAACTPEALALGRPAPFRDFAGAVMGLRFDEEPPYAALIAMFEPLLAAGPGGAGAPARPLPLDVGVALDVAGRKRGREALAALRAPPAGGGPPKKRARTGLPATQWVTVFGARRPMKQRYHHNVAAHRLEAHVAKGYADGLRIACAAAQGEVWAVIMDAGTGLGHQTYRLSPGPRAFMPKAWIVEQWDAGLYITCAAGTPSGASLVVMSRGTRYVQQSYKVADAFPYEWIRKKWREGYAVTSLAAGGGQWAAVVSRGAPLGRQAVELDFQYPSEGIHARWADGYRITAVGATPDQCAAVLSRPPPGGWRDDDAQETLRTSAFPGEHVKEKWAKDLYITALAYGRTVT